MAECTKRLEEQDALWNTRRQARRDSDHVTVGVRELLDLYEPEALCFSDGRFGLRQQTGGSAATAAIKKRYQAFGDGLNLSVESI
jgi:hypothetical protein